MPRYCRSLGLSAALLTLSAGAAAAQGPNGTYYLTAGDQHTNWMVTGLSTASAPQANSLGTFSGEYAVAVSGDVRTLGVVDAGSQYTLGLAYTGTTYGDPGVGQLYDGGTDGIHNYSVTFATGTPTVYQFARDWSSPVALFSPSANSFALGITYDQSNNSLWLSDFVGTGVVNYSMSGTVLSSFSAPIGQLTSLAMDYSDGTLWMGSQSTQGTFYQYSRAGVLLQTQSYASLTDQNTLGGEFDITPSAVTTPEPASLAMVAGGLGLLGLGARRQRRRAVA